MHQSTPTATAESSELSRRVLTKVSWRLFPFMMLLYVINYLDRINISFAGPQMEKSLGFGAETFGFGAGLFFIGYFIFGVPSNMMLARIGARRWISIITTLWGIASVSMSLVNNLNTFYLMRFLLGAAEAGFFPGMILYLTYWFPKSEHAKAVARFMSAIPLAGVLGGLVSSKILGMQGVMGLDGWKWLFLITGSPAILLGFVVLFALKDSPQQAAWLSSAERDWLVQKLESEKHQKVKSTESSSPAAPAQAASHSVFSNPRVWHLALLYFSLTLGMYGFQLWLPQIIMSFDKLSDASSALLSAIPAIFQALGMILVAAHSDKKRERRWHVACSATLASLSLILCGFSHNPVLSLCLLCLTAFGIWGTVGPFWALPPSYLPASSAAAGIGLINSVGNLGGFAGPYLVGWLKQHTPDFVYSLIALAISLFCGGILALAVKAKSPAEQPEVLK